MTWKYANKVEMIGKYTKPHPYIPFTLECNWWDYTKLYRITVSQVAWRIWYQRLIVCVRSQQVFLITVGGFLQVPSNLDLLKTWTSDQTRLDRTGPDKTDQKCTGSCCCHVHSMPSSNNFLSTQIYLELSLFCVLKLWSCLWHYNTRQVATRLLAHIHCNQTKMKSTEVLNPQCVVIMQSHRT